MNELNSTLMSTEIGAEVTGYVLADVRGVNNMGECSEDTSKGVELHFAPNPQDHGIHRRGPRVHQQHDRGRTD